MATTINSGYANSPKLTANIADHADVYGGRALVFDGVTDYLTCGTGLGNQLGNGYSKDTGLTASLWFKNDGTTDGGLFQIGNNGGAGEFSFQIDNNNDLYFLLNGNGWHRKIAFTDTSSWHHVVCVYGSSQDNSKIYLDGESVGTAGGSFPSTLDFNGLHTTIGSYWNLIYRFNGKITDVKVFNTELTEAQVTELYKKPENTPSAVQDNLVAWYPMSEANPESPQSIVYDHSEKGLGSELISNSTFDNGTDWTEVGDFTIINGVASITSASQYSQLTAYSSNFLNSGKTYKLEVDITTLSISGALAYRVSGGDVTPITTSEIVNDKYTTYFTMTQDGWLWFQTTGGFTGLNVVIDNVTIKEVLMGNHATTNFFGDELIDSNARTFEGTSTYGWEVYGNNTVTNDSNTLKITRVDNNQGAYLYLRDATDLTTNLTVGTTYLLKGDFLTTDASKTFTVRLSNSGGTDIAYNSLNNTSFVTQEFKFVAGHATNAFIVVENLVSGGVVKVDNLTLKEVGISSSGFETAVNEPVVPQVPLMRYNQKAIFDGVDDYVSFGGDVSLANDFTIGIWASTLKSGSNDFLGHASDTTFIRTDTGNNRLRIRNTSGSIANLTSLTTPTDGSIFHLVLSRSSNVITAYLNGVKTGDTPTLSGTLNINEIGNVSGNTEYDGLIFSVSIFNSAFTETQAQELFNDGVAYDATTHSKASALKAYWRNDGVTTWKNRGDNFASFDGVDDVITRNAINVDYKSVSFWVRPSTTFTTASSGKQIMFFGNWDFGSITLGTATGNLNNELITMVDNQGSGTVFTGWIPTGGETIPNDSWTHIAFVWDGSKYVIYYNGQPQTVTTSGTGHVGLHTNKNIKIGTGNTGDIPFDGDMANVAFWSESLTDAQVLSVYNSGHNGNIASIQSSDLELYYTFNSHASTDPDTNSSVQDRSGNNRDSTSITGAVIDKDGTVQGTPDSITIREGLNSNRDGLGFYFTNPSSNVLRLNGVDEQIIVPDTDFNFIGQMTFECWAKNNSDNNTVNEFLISQWNFSNNQRAFRAFIHSNGALYCTISDTGTGSSSNTSQANTTNAISNLDNWHHYAFTFSSGTFVIYIDGVAVTISTGSVVAGMTSIHNSTADIQIGSQYPPNATGGEWNGLIDEVKIYNRALSLAEIQKNYKHQKGKHKND